MEIERKFLVDLVPEGLLASSGIPIQQGYLAIDEEAEVRLRRAGANLTLTVKQGHGESRSETEVEIDRATFDDLWPESDGRRVEKERHLVELEGELVAELDLYSGPLADLEVVEVEFASESAAADFAPPAWFGRELTGDRAWANQSLAVNGRPERRLEFRLRPDEEPATGVCRVITARAAQAVAEIRQAGAADDSAKHVHEARKSLKKVRSALRLLRGAIGDEERREVNASCREAAGRLSGPRDAEVKLTTLTGVIEGSRETEGAAEWRRELEAEAREHRRDLTPEGLDEAARAIDQVARRFRGRELPGLGEAVAGNVGRGYRRGRRSMKKARKSDAPETFHGWRKRAKDLRYQLEIVEARLPAEFTGLRKRAEDLADRLGDLHDLDLLLDDLGARDLRSSDAARLARVIADARARQAERCLEAGTDTYVLKPGKFTNRIGESLS